MRKVILSVAVFAACASMASATVFLNENFDGYADQAAFQAAWAANTTTAVLSTEQFVSAGNSVKAGTTAMRNARNVGEIGSLAGSSDYIVFRFKFYDSGGAAYREYAELDDGLSPSGSGQIFAMGLNNNLTSSHYMARILGGDGGTGSGAFFKLDGTGAPTRSVGWHTLEARIYDSEVKYYVDSVLSKTVNISSVTDRSLDTVKVGSNLSSTGVAYFDDVYVARLPEPATMILLALGGLMLRRRRLA